MPKIKINLPRVYDNPNNNEKFEKHVGMPKISYSQIDSWNNPLYRGRYIASYFLGIEDPGNVFSDFGSAVGEWFEHGEDKSGKLSESDLEVLEKIGRPGGCEYEREIVVKRPLGYVIQGFIDRARKDKWEKEHEQLEVIDFKTGNIEKKADFYASEEYQQTTLYTFAAIEEGEDVIYSGVVMLGRKGNGMEKSPLRLSGEVITIDTPYSEERAEEFFKKTDNTVKEINEYFKFYNKYFAE